MSSRVHDPANVALHRRVLAVPGLPFPGRVFRDGVGVLGDREKPVLLFAAAAVVSANDTETNRENGWMESSIMGDTTCSITTLGITTIDAVMLSHLC